MKRVKIVFPFFLLPWLWLVFALPAKCQMLDTTNVFRIKLLQSNEQFPAWSEDGSKLVFQSAGSGYAQLFLYDFFKDTLIQITFDETHKSHPVFVPNQNQIAFDVYIHDQVKIFKLDLTTGVRQPFFRRSLLCEAPSFSPSGRWAVFKGRDPNRETWQLFSYDFVYDNLNQLTHVKNSKLSRPVLSPDGKIILFGTRDNAVPYTRSLHEINWYGEKIRDLDSLAVSSYGWLANSYRIVCSMDEPHESPSFFTITKDGTYMMPLCSDTLHRVNPALSPDGKKIAVAAKFGNNFDIVVYNLIDE